MKIKIILKKANSTTMTKSEIFKCYKASTLSDAQNAGNRISELLDFNFFWGEGMPPDPPRGKGPCGLYYTFSGCLQLKLLKPLPYGCIKQQQRSTMCIMCKMGVYENAMKPLTAAGTVKTDTCT